MDKLKTRGGLRAKEFEERVREKNDENLRKMCWLIIKSIKK